MQVIRSVQAWLGKSGVYVSRQRPYDLGWVLRDLFERARINCVIDVGAHYGEYAGFVRRVLRFPGRLASFEPVTASFDTLAQAAAHDPEWLTFPFALGPTAASARMHIFESGVFNSLLEPTGYAARRFGAGGSTTGVEEVTVRRLDDLIDQVAAGIPEPRIYLKMDTQGYDQHVLAGAERSLASVVALQSEVAVQHLYDNVPNFELAVAKYRDLGFSPVGFFPVVKETDELGVIEFDYVAIRR